MSAVPVFGHAVQAPIVIAPNAVPRVSANCVEPRPKTAATAKAEQESEKQSHDRSDCADAHQLPRGPLVGRRDRVGRPATRRAPRCGLDASAGERARGVVHHALDPQQHLDRALGQHGRPRLRRALPAPGAAATCGAAPVGPGATPGSGLSSMP